VISVASESKTEDGTFTDLMHKVLILHTRFFMPDKDSGPQSRQLWEFRFGNSGSSFYSRFFIYAR
jgi:hypothetical protein